MKLIKSKKAAMEMSVGTIVTIVLLMSVLVMGLMLVQTIFSSSQDSIEGINTAVESEINKLFSEDDSRRVVVYPSSGEITIRKGESSKGFGFAIRNVNNDQDSFSYEVAATETSCSDSLSTDEATKYIALGKVGQNILINAGDIMTNPVFVKFAIPETAPPCIVRYSVQLYHNGGQVYDSPVYVDLQIESK